MHVAYELPQSDEGLRKVNVGLRTFLKLETQALAMTRYDCVLVSPSECDISESTTGLERVNIFIVIPKKC